MTFTEIKPFLWEGALASRENWATNFYVEAAHQDRTKRLQLIDSTGRDYGISAADEAATDWIIYEERPQ